MKSQSHLPPVVIAVTALLLLGGLGAVWPRWVGAAPGRAVLTPLETIGDAVTYQGYLTDEEGMPLTGSFTMRFEIYNEATDGTLLWESGTTEISVLDGLFEARLAIATDIFNGEALWVAQTIDGELLTPRQEILPAPMAHTLRPGAIVKGTANAIPNNYLLDVQMNNDTFAFNRGAISGQSTTGNAVYGLATSGRALYGQTEDGYAVYGFDGGSDADRGYAGYFYSTNGIGVYGYSGADRSHPNILAPGVYGQSNQGVGVYGRGDTSNSFSFYNEGGYFEGGKGLYARGTDPSNQQGYGARVYSDNYHGMYVRGASGFYDAYFGGAGGINVDHVIARNAARSLVINAGGEPIAPGDLVALAGAIPSPLTGEPMLAVAKLNADNANALIGVATGAIVVEHVPTEDGGQRSQLATTDGLAAGDGLLAMVTEGLVPAVNLDSLARVTKWAIGDRIAIAAGGEMTRSSRGDELMVVGRVAGPVDPGQQTIPLYVDIK